MYLPLQMLHHAAGLFAAICQGAKTHSLAPENSSALLVSQLYYQWMYLAGSCWLISWTMAQPQDACPGPFLQQLGCARLGANPGPAVIEACVAAMLRNGSSNCREAANVSWALAVLEVRCCLSE